MLPREGRELEFVVRAMGLPGGKAVAPLDRERRLPVSTNAVTPPIAPPSTLPIWKTRKLPVRTEAHGARLVMILAGCCERLIWLPGGQWSGRGSNPQPPHCERGALPIELPPHLDYPN